MTQFKSVFKLAVPGFTPPALRTIKLNVTRDGQSVESVKEALIWNSLYSRKSMVDIPILGLKGEATCLASAIDGLRGMMIYDYDPVHPYAAVRNIVINQDLVLNIDLNDGTAGGSTEPTDPATASAVIRVNKQPAVREVLAVEKRTDGTWRFAGSTLISKTGDLELQVTGGEVYAIGVDDFGIPYQAGLDLELGQTVRPTLFQGWLYECTEVGQLPGTEPTWWPEEGENPPRLVGTARLQAVRYYQPIAHGPIHYELI